MKRLLSTLVILFVPVLLLAQTTISGKITDAVSGEPLIGASVLVVGTTLGDASNVDGDYEITNVPSGNYTIRVSSVGYETINRVVRISGSSMTINFQMTQTSASLEALEVFASRSDQTTPVAYSNISKEDLVVQLGSRDLPEVLNITPSVYSTNQGGGAGDARINVRGFSQRNVAVMMNGVPVNDMENGWVYWSNWDGVGDVARSVQVQRGISNVNLAVPSVGGTLNVITEPSSAQAGGAIKYENGSGAFTKTTAIINSGLINDKFAFSAVGVRKTGDGIVDGTWTDAWAYHLAASYQINEDNRLDLFALGAPQRHGQRLYAQNIGTFSASYARSLDSYDPAALDDYQERGFLFNQNIGGVSPSYTGNQYVGDRWVGASITDRYDPNFLMERENFFHKPQVNLNWYSQLSDKLSLTNVLYYSGGRGGGTGTYGEVLRMDANGVSSSDTPFFFGPAPWTWNWDETIAINSSPSMTWQNDFDSGTKADFESIGILRNSRNNQWTIGDIVKLNYTMNENVELQAGLDWRTAEIEHYREVRDLLGGQFYIDDGDDFNPNKRVGLGDKIDYNYTNTVDWLGGYIQGEYTTEEYSVYATGGISTVKYTHENFFMDDPNIAGLQKLERESDNIVGYQLKAGGLYSVNDNIDVFANFGTISKVPIFDNVISDATGAVNRDPKNERFLFYEGGVRLYDNAGKFGANINYYITDRKDRSFTRGITQEDGTEGLLNISGLDQRHSGIEVEMSYQATSWARIDFMTSHNLWEYRNDVSATYRPDLGNPATQEINLYVEGLKVGNAPQTQYAYMLNVRPIDPLSLTFVGTSYLRHFSDFDPITRDDPNDRAQTWKVPNYSVFNLHLNYELDGVLEGASFFANVFNIFDEVYIQDATDNSRFNSFDDDHDADDAEVFFGLPRRYNFGVRVNF